MLSPDAHSLGDAAVELALAGWSVFPCHPTGPRAKSPISALVPHGHLNATRDPEVIQRWWRECPNAMIGGAVPASFIVIDIDPRNGGSLDVLEALVGALTETLTVWSGREDRGRHFYYLRPGGAFTSTRLPDGIDLKVHGYCILPPSIHPATGRPYRWELREPAPLPGSLLSLLRPLPSPPRVTSGLGSVSADALVRFVAGLQPGERNRGTYWAACRAADDGVLDGLAADLVAAAMQTGLPEREAIRIVQSARRSAGIRS
ncbi:MAG: DNA primase [Chloroflexi bacterium HGW-Chloroflexi-9]|nr:MAG: DNA primase [Chloroflexi bacterium HGW-Chloroflexi-9]